MYTARVYIKKMLFLKRLLNYLYGKKDWYWTIEFCFVFKFRISSVCSFFQPCKMISRNQHPLFFLQRGQKRTIESVSEKNITTQFFYNWSKVSSTNENLKRSIIFRSVSIVLIYHLLSDDVSLFFPQSDFTQQNQSNCVAVFCECK